ncbi:MAG: hypothetical protein QM751_06210 [Paludibacteraceae bacterium]
MANFFKNVAKGIGNVAKKIAKPLVTAVGTAVGSMVGLPALGAVAGSVIDKLGVSKAKKVVAAVQSSGFVDPVKAKETIKTVTGVEPSNSEVAHISQDLSNNLGVPVLETPQVKVDSSGNVSAKFDLKSFVKKYWYGVLAGVIGIYFLFIKKGVKSSRRRF